MPTTVIGCLENLEDTELTAFLRAMDQVIAAERAASDTSAVAWFKALRDAGEWDQRRRDGRKVTEPATPFEDQLYAAARRLPDAAIVSLMRQYHDLFSGESTVAFGHPLAMLGGVAYIILQVEHERRAPLVA